MVDERTFTQGLAAFFGARSGDLPGLLVGIGDDAAVVRAERRPLVLKIDPVVEGVHVAAALPAARLGIKAVNRNLSDLAAMGAVPRWLLASVLLPRGYPAARRAGIFRGLRAAARGAGVRVVGGDVSNTRGAAAVVVAAFGVVPGRPLLRSGARVGDTLHVTGALGGSCLGRHHRFVPRLREGLWLARDPAVHAAMDVSDGLLLDLQTLLDASGCPGAELEEAAIPIASAARRLARRSGTTALAHALGDGEDYELLFAARGTLRRNGPLAPLAHHPIGRITSRRGLWLRTLDGRLRRLRPEGYRHAL
ncbi:MAG: thiamine-phosphate kinase [Planctomycetes bacterium]|nr:thiamine-phosphate kinase [Planctomycetota bacterium]